MITIETIQCFYNWLATASQHSKKKDLNRNTIERISGLTSRMFKVAYEMKIIDDMPFKMTIKRGFRLCQTHGNGFTLLCWFILWWLICLATQTLAWWKQPTLAPVMKAS